MNINNSKSLFVTIIMAITIVMTITQSTVNSEEFYFTFPLAIALDDADVLYPVATFCATESTVISGVLHRDSTTPVDFSVTLSGPGCAEHTFVPIDIAPIDYSYTSIYFSSDINIEIVLCYPNNQYHINECAYMYPLPASGKEYYLMTYNSPQITYIANTDNTEVVINNRNHNINQYQILNVASTSLSSDYTGSIITMNNPTTVLSSGVCSVIPSTDASTNCNFLLEQLLPTSTFGTNYILAPLSDSNGYIVRILAYSDNTQVYINGTQHIIHLRKAEHYDYEVTSQSYIEIDSFFPIYVAQFEKSEGKAGYATMMMPTSIQQAKSSYYLVQPYQNVAKAAIIIAESSKDKLLFDGTQININWTPIPSTPFFTSLGVSNVGAIIDYPAVANEAAFVYVSTSDSSPFIVSLFGHNDNNDYFSYAISDYVDISTDSDGDGVPNTIDLCAGVDDSIDFDLNGLPDCYYMPYSYDLTYYGWKCGFDGQVDYCDNGVTKCDWFPNVRSDIDPSNGVFFGECMKTLVVGFHPPK